MSPGQGEPSALTPRAHAALVQGRLRAEYPDARCELEFENAFQLAVATILSAQTTDVRVNAVTPALFARYSSARDLAEADLAEVEELVRTTGFFRNKARNIVGFARGVVERHKGRVPRTMEELVALPGIGRKTANVVLGNAFGVNEGIVVDTHVKRLAKLLGLTRNTDPVKVERDLMPLFPREDWTMLAHLLIWHGRRVCVARRPRCESCVLADACPSARVG